MNYYKNLDILNSKRKQLYSDIQNISNDKELLQYLKNVSDNIDSSLESLFNDCHGNLPFMKYIYDLVCIVWCDREKSNKIPSQYYKTIV